MPKKAAGRKKGIQRSVPRHRVGSRKIAQGDGEESNQTADGKLLGLSRSKYFYLGQKCFDSTFALCTKLRFIGITRSPSGEYVRLDRKDMVVHCVVSAFYYALCLRNTWETLHILLYEELRAVSFLSVSITGVSIASIVVVLGIEMRPKEATDMLNSWSYISMSAASRDSGTTSQPDISTCCRVIALCFCCYGITTAISVSSVVVSNLTICLFPTAARYGLIPEGILPNLGWQLLFAPLEFLLYLPPILVGHLGGSLIFMGNGAIRVYMEPLRAARVVSMASRRRLERMYVQLELFNRIFQVWIRFFFPPWLLAYAMAVIITLFVTIRYTELPLILYVLFPNTAFTLLTLFFWHCLDMLRVGRESEDILGMLLQQRKPYLINKTRTERVEVMKRARVMRPMTFRLADCEFSMSVPVGTWEEILNQVVFLMSL